MSTLKKSSDGLSRSWEVQSSLKPFYGGSKIDISCDVASNSGLFGCIFNETLSIVDLETLAVKTNVLNESNSDKDSDIEQEGVTCFCLLPNKETVMVAMASTYVLKHMHIGSSGVSVIRTIKGHQMPILAMECDASGSLLATGSSDRIVRVFDIAGGFCTHTFREHTDIISIVRFIPSIVNIIGSRGEGDTSVLVDANNIDLCSASDDKSMMIHNLGTNTQINAFYDHMATPTCISLTPSDAVPHLQFLASSGRDKVINLYAIEAESKKKQPLNKYTFIKTILMKTDELECISFVKMNATTCPIKKKKCVEAILAAGGSCGTLKIICITHYSHTSVEYRLNYEYSLHTMLVQQIHYIPGLDELLVSTSDNNIYFYASVCWDKEEDQECTRELAGNLDDVLDIVVFPDATHEEEDDSSTTEEESDAGAISMAVVTNSKTLRFMDCREGSYLTKQSITIHDDVILAIDCSVDG